MQAWTDTDQNKIHRTPFSVTPIPNLIEIRSVISKMKYAERTNRQTTP
jgi:hypothetical protein